MKVNYYYYVLLLLISFACEKDDGPSAPEGATLVFPLQNSECTTGISVTDDLSQVTFEWQASANTDTYTLSAVNLNTNTPQTITVDETFANLTIAKGAPYSWTVSSSNTSSDVTATSENRLFYNAGSQINYAPFPAQVVAPVSGSTVQINEAGQIGLSWIGADVEDNIVSFQVFFSEENPPTNLIETTNGITMEVAADVVSGSTYYWKIITMDNNGNTSDSGVYDFRVL